MQNIKLKKRYKNGNKTCATLLCFFINQVFKKTNSMLNHNIRKRTGLDLGQLAIGQKSFFTFVKYTIFLLVFLAQKKMETIYKATQRIMNGEFKHNSNEWFQRNPLLCTFIYTSDSCRTEAENLELSKIILYELYQTKVYFQPASAHLCEFLPVSSGFD